MWGWKQCESPLVGDPEFDPNIKVETFAERSRRVEKEEEAELARLELQIKQAFPSKSWLIAFVVVFILVVIVVALKHLT